MQQYKLITDQNLTEKVKNGAKKILYTGRKIYTDSLMDLHEKFNATRIEGFSLSVFYSNRPFYVSKPIEKEKESCLCIDCLNLHLVLKSISKSRSVDVHEY